MRMLLAAVFLSCCVGVAADDNITPSDTPSELPTTNPSSSLSPTNEPERIEIFNHTGTVQRYTIPKDDYYAFTAVGAKGGDCNGCDKATCEYEDIFTKDWCYKCDAQFHEGGHGTLVRGTFYLHKGDEIEAVVGGRGENCRKIRQQLPVVGGEQKKTPDGRDYLEALTGAGGGGASSVRVKYAADGQEDLLLIAGGGGGAAKFHNGEDGEIGQSGGWDWGGRNGQGGGLGPPPPISLFSQFGGAGGGGVSGNGDSMNILFNNTYELWAEGGVSLSNGSQGGYVDKYSYYEDGSETMVTAQSGSAGGYGSGGQGGIGK